MQINQFNSSLIIQSHPISSKPTFVSAAVALDSNGVAYHAGIVVKALDQYKLLHYTGSEVLFEDVPVYGSGPHTWYYHKDFMWVDEILTIPFYGYCERVSEYADPKYGFLFPDSFYSDSSFVSTSLPEYMTCVGFCLNVIQGFTPKRRYLDTANWGDYSEIPDQDRWVNKFLSDFKADNPQFTEAEILKHLKRIAPDEYFTSAYFLHSPIKRADIHTILPDVKTELQLRMFL